MNDEERQLRAALYLRVSTDDQAEKGYGLEAQEAALRAFISSRGVLSDGSPRMVLAKFDDDSPRIYVDDGVSGTVEYTERGAFATLMCDYENALDGSKPFDTVCVYKIDRLARTLQILLDVVKYFKERHISLVSVNESIDTNTPFGMAILGIMGVIAQLELDTIKLRMQAGREAKARTGKCVGAVPYGYQKNSDDYLVPFAPEAEIVKRIFSMFICEHLSTQRIATYLQNERVLNPDGSALKHGKKKSKKELKKPNFLLAG